MNWAVEVENVVKIYRHKFDGTKISALQGCDLLVRKGEVLAVIGPSGAGKSTLLRLIAGIEQPSSGRISIGGISIQDWDETRRREFRRKFIGTFSQHARDNLDPDMKVSEAIEWELINADWKRDEIAPRIARVLERLNIAGLRNSLCRNLSAGEAMRVSLAKAIAKKPFVVLADEPSGQLDTENMNLLFKLMKEAAKEGTAIVVATHDTRFQALADRSVMILEGKLASEEEGIDLLQQHLDLDKLREQGELTRTVIVDSTKHIRLPSPVIYTLELNRKAKIVIDFRTGNVRLEKHPEDDQFIVDAETKEPELKFSRENVQKRPFITFEKVNKSYDGKTKIDVIKNLDLEILEGEFVVLLGPSGVGKTTLIGMISGLEKPTSGTLSVKGTQLEKMSVGELSAFRKKNISLLTQNYILHPYLTVEENIALSYRMMDQEVDRKSIMAVLNKLEMTRYANVYPGELSGGQRQRVAFTSAFLKPNYDLILLDEPTANLDSILARKIMNLLTELAETGKTVLLATHDLTMVRPGYRVLRIKEQRIFEDVIATEEYCNNLKKEYFHQ
ncbi:MAG: ABC transporter ATP-binding protein [Methanobacteriota archaeon]|nr:MAG: ABC transporter ATP-binding protein [Euryarchaeota archaeon]